MRRPGPRGKGRSLCGRLVSLPIRVGIIRSTEVLKPPFGPYPAELAEIYPFNAEVPEDADEAALDQATRITKELMRANPGARFGFRMKRTELEERLGL